MKLDTAKKTIRIPLDTYFENVIYVGKKDLNVMPALVKELDLLNGMTCLTAQNEENKSQWFVSFLSDPNRGFKMKISDTLKTMLSSKRASKFRDSLPPIGSYKVEKLKETIDGITWYKLIANETQS